MGLHSIIGIALALCVSEPADGGSAHVSELYEQGTLKYETADYAGAIEAFTQAYGKAAEIEDHHARQTALAALLFNLARSHVKAHELDGKQEHLLRARDLLKKYLSRNPGAEDTQSATQLLSEVEGKLGIAPEPDLPDSSMNRTKADAEPGSALDVALHADVAGGLQYGLGAAVEFGKRRIAGLVGVRIPNVGVVPYFAVRPEGAEYAVGVGANAGVRFYTNRRATLDRFFLGLQLEYDYVKTKPHDTDTHDISEKIHETHSLGPGLHLGYRWIIGESFFVSLGVRGGVVFPFKLISADDPDAEDTDSADDVCGEEDFNEDACLRRPPAFIGGLVLELGGFLAQAASRE